ncbi:MAG: DUF3365 domain-containing protein [Isosphaeraceae bacterium]
MVDTIVKRHGVGVSALMLMLAAGLGLATTVRGGASVEDPSVAKARATVKMLDDLFKVAVVDITKRYDGPPAAKVAKTIFAAAKEKHYFQARILDATGSPLNEANAPTDSFEKAAAKAMQDGKAYYEEVVGEGATRRLRAATVVPAVVEKCAKCHGVKKGELLGFLSYDLPLQ